MRQTATSVAMRRCRFTSSPLPRCLTVGRSAASRASKANGPSECENGEPAAAPFSALRFGNLHISTDLSGKEVVDFAVARNGGRLACDSIHEDGVT